MEGEIRQLRGLMNRVVLVLVPMRGTHWRRVQGVGREAMGPQRACKSRVREGQTYTALQQSRARQGRQMQWLWWSFFRMRLARGVQLP